MAQVPSSDSPQLPADEAEKLRAAEKAKEEDIYNNFATPLVGTFLNLPAESVLVKCPACGNNGATKMQHELKWWAMEINQLVGCLFVTFCLCFCFNWMIPCKQTDCNHYCANCGCYLGRAMKYAPIKPKNR